MFRALSVIGRGLRLFFVYGLGKPLIYLLGFFLKPLAIALYKLYRLLKKEYIKLNLPTGQKFFHFFTHKYFIHFIIVAITLSVASNSLSAREIKLEEFGKKTLFSALVASDLNQETTEGIETVLVQNSYLAHEDALRARIMPADGSAQTENILVTTDEGTALVKNTLPDTSLTGQPRENIESYQVKGGDTISTIAGRFGISSKTILWANSLNDMDYIKPGQTLTIPPVSGVLYKVQKNDTIASIAKKFKADEGAIMEYNMLADASAIDIEDQLMIPGGQIEPPPAPVQKKSSSGFASIFSGNAPPSARVPEGSRLLWPTPSHKINQYYKWRHTGLDIDGNYSSPIYAAANGTAEKVGQGTGYGNVIIINHGGGKKTVYAHLSKFFVKQGQAVSKGQTIGMMGCTGWCTGTHLHFEVIISGTKVNPLSYL